MRYCFIFSVISLLFIHLAISTESILYILVLLNFALAFGGLGLAYGTENPRLFMKKPSGKLSLLSYLIFWPYFLQSWISLFLYRSRTQENAVDEIWPGVFLGRQLFERERDLISSKGIRSTLDVTSEFSEVKFILASQDYLNLPLLDVCPPTGAQFEKAIDWLSEQKSKGPLFVHCALGHGRSATILAAFMVKEKVATSGKEAIEAIKKIRPGVALKTNQLTALEAYLANLNSN